MKAFALVSIAVLFGLDQLSKIFVRNNLEDPVILWDPWLIFRFVENEGVAFSMPVPQVFVIVLTVVVLLYLLYLLFWRSLPRYEILALILVFSGALGNLVDRIQYGKVTDFIAVGNFPVFNIADTCISIGVVVYLVGEILLKQKK